MKKTKLCLIAFLIAVILMLSLAATAGEETKTIKSSKSFVKTSRRVNEGFAIDDIESNYKPHRRINDIGDNYKPHKGTMYIHDFCTQNCKS